MVVEGRIRVNGRVVSELGSWVDPARDRVEVDGRPVAVQPLRWILLHKPRGCVTIRSDRERRPTVYDLLPGEFGALSHVGRLDADTEGLLLLSNEGEVAHRLLHPSVGVEREYEAWVRGVPTAATLRRLERGVTLSDGVARALRARLLEVQARLDGGGRVDGGRRAKTGRGTSAKTGRGTGASAGRGTGASAGRGTGAKALVRLVLREGRNREVRRLCAAVGHPVVGLRRVRFGPIRLGRTPRGGWRELTGEEIALLRRAAAGKGAPKSRS